MKGEGQEVARDRQGEVIKVVGSGKGVDGDWLCRGLAEDKGIQGGRGCYIPPGR